MNFNLAKLVELGQNKQYKELKQQLDSQEKIFENNAEKIIQQLLLLNINEQTLLYSYCLVNIKVNQESFELFDKFLKYFDEFQMKLQIKQFTYICKNYIKYLQSSNATHLAIRALQVALIKLNKVQASFTTINTIFLQLCIEHRFYKQAVKVIRMPIVNIIPKSQTDDLDLAIYFYHAGEIMTECKYFKEAQQFFQDCLQFQFKQIYEVHQEAKKKLILLNIRKGKFQDYKEDKKQSAITRNTSNDVLNVVCDNYRQLGDKKNIKNQEDFDQKIASQMEFLKNEGNLGLANQCRFSIIYCKLKELRQIYSRLTINDLYGRLQLNPSQYSIQQLQFEINKIKPIFEIDPKNNAIKFKSQEDIDHETTILEPLSNQFELLQSLFLEFQKEHQENINVRLQNQGQQYF